MKSKSIKRLRELESLKRVRVIPSGDIYYTDKSWETKEVDGVVFVYVIKNNGNREIPKLMRKDSLEYVLR